MSMTNWSRMIKDDDMSQNRVIANKALLHSVIIAYLLDFKR